MFLKTLQKAEIFTILVYKRTISPLLRDLFKGGCRYDPTCSEYSLQAINKYGPFKGLLLSLIRFLKCSPFSRHSRKYPLI